MKQNAYLVGIIDLERTFNGDVYMSEEKAKSAFVELLKNYTDDEDEIEDALNVGYYDTDDSESVIFEYINIK